MSTNTRITRSKGKSDGLSLPTRTRPTRKETISEKDGGTALNTSCNVGLDQHHQKAPTHTLQLPAQSPQANPVRMMETPVPMLPPGQHRPLTPHTPLPTSPTSGSQLSQLSAPLFKEDRYSSTSEEETEADAEVTLINGRNQPNRTFTHNSTTEKPMSTLTTTDYTTQGDLNQVSPSTPTNMFMSTAKEIEFSGTSNFFVPDGSDRHIHQIHFPRRLPGEWQQCISLRTTCTREDAKYVEVLNGRDVRTILCCVRQELPVDVYKADVKTNMGHRRAH